MVDRSNICYKMVQLECDANHKVHIIGSDDYNPEWNCAFPKDLKKPGQKYSTPSTNIVMVKRTRPIASRIRSNLRAKKYGLKPKYDETHSYSFYYRVRNYGLIELL